MKKQTSRNNSSQRNALNKIVLLSFVLCAASIMISLRVNAQDSTLKVHYTFERGIVADSVADNSGNGYNGALKNGATVRQVGRFNVLDLGSVNGYLDMGRRTGEIIQTLNDFTVALNVYIDPTTNLDAIGNFVWVFANSDYMKTDANGSMFVSAKDTEYGISTDNWVSEKVVKATSRLSKGAWQHVTYTQSGTTGSLFINNVKVQTGVISTKPSVLGATASNYLGRSCYIDDAFLKNSMLNDFRLYNRALSVTEIGTLASQTAGLDSALNMQQITDAKSKLVLNGLEAVEFNLILPTVGENGVSITWSSDNQDIISNSGVLARPALGSEPTIVKLTATLSKNGFIETKEFITTVLPIPSDHLSVERDSINLTIVGNQNPLKHNLTLQVKGNDGSTITWSSDKPDTLSNTGTIVNYSAKGAGNARVLLTATISKGTVSTTKTFEVYIAEIDCLDGYLFVYFTGDAKADESIHFALSNDGYNYKALNNNNPVLNSSVISSTGGIRDPHILRGEDGNYYMVTTDMVSSLGWYSNRGIVLLKSSNLTDWQSTPINITKTFSKYSTAIAVWAPQTIYDPTVGKYMIYFAMCLGDFDYNRLYYAYANSTFTALESEPKILYELPYTNIIDGDITYKDGLYQMFFKNDNTKVIQKVVSSKLTEGYEADLNAKIIQGQEGPCVFKLINSNYYILMTDNIGDYKFSITSDLENFTDVSSSFSYDFYPKHGTVLPITIFEKQALIAKWGVTGVEPVIEKNVITVFPNPVKDILNLSVGECNSGITATIYSLTGEALLHKTMTTDKAQINVSGLSPGIYVIRCKTSDSILGYAKFIVL